MFAQKCLEQDPEALRLLPKRYKEKATAYLLASGAKPREARDFVATLWADCTMGTSTTPPKLLSYNGKCALQTWLNTVALNDWLTEMRWRSRWHPPSEPSEEPPPSSPAPIDEPEPEAVLLTILREALQAAFDDCSAQQYVLLQFISVDQLKLEEVGKVFRCSEASVRRMLVEMKRQFKKTVLDHIQKSDPLLELKWADLMKLCGVVGPGFFGVGPELNLE